MGDCNGVVFSIMYNFKGYEYKIVFFIGLSVDIYFGLFFGVINWMEEEIVVYYK